MASSKDKKINDLINYVHQVKPYRSKMLALVHRIHFSDTLNLNFEERFRETKSAFKMAEQLKLILGDDLTVQKFDILDVINDNVADSASLAFSDSLDITIEQAPLTLDYFTSAIYPIDVIEDSKLVYNPPSTTRGLLVEPIKSDKLSYSAPALSGTLANSIVRLSINLSEDKASYGIPTITGSLQNTLNRLSIDVSTDIAAYNEPSISGTLQTTLQRVSLTVKSGSSEGDLVKYNVPTISGTLS